MTKRKVVCISGEWGENSDFVLEPACDDENCTCIFCKDAFWIEDCEEEKK